MTITIQHLSKLSIVVNQDKYFLGRHFWGWLIIRMVQTFGLNLIDCCFPSLVSEVVNFKLQAS